MYGYTDGVMHAPHLRTLVARAKKLHPFVLPACGIMLAVLVAGLSLRIVAHKGDSSEKETLTLIRSVGELIILPEDEAPTIATVTDPEALKGMPLFARAETGDKVLVYRESGKAILYSPMKKRIVDVMPIDTREHKN